ncbi:hypothetical protein FRC01_006937 [Tulasnella sp. 417]|nr:hypothetical protein FRC01_006937 [Tulasnella sp. 417]
MKVFEDEATRISLFARDVCQRLNQSVSKQEHNFLKPTGFTGSRRYEPYFRAHGHTIIIMDAYAERGIEVQVDNPRPVDEVITLIRQRQLMDFCRGNLHGDLTLQRAFSRFERMLKDPFNTLVIPSQRTKQFRVRKADHPEYCVVEDLRDLPDREGDFVWWCSTIYDRIRAALYMAVPYTYNSPQARESHPGNQFKIMMGEPEMWRIEDRVLKKTLYLGLMQAQDKEFSIMRWYLMENAVHDYNCKQFEHITGSCTNDTSHTRTKTANRPSTPPDETTGRRVVKRRPRRILTKAEPAVKEEPLEREMDTTSRRVPSPLPNNYSDLPSLVQILSSGISDIDDDPNVARTLSEISADEVMEDVSDWIEEPSERVHEEAHTGPYSDPPPIARTVLASIKRY